MRITEITQITLRNALGIPHSFHLFPSISYPFLSLYFKVFQCVNALRFASALAPVNEEKEGEKEKPRIRKLSSHTVRALCTDSEIMREKRESEKEKGAGRVQGKRKILRKKENTGNCPFENIGFYLVITDNKFLCYALSGT